jgi:hypothetical protein
MTPKSKKRVRGWAMACDCHGIHLSTIREKQRDVPMIPPPDNGIIGYVQVDIIPTHQSRGRKK